MENPPPQNAVENAAGENPIPKPPSPPPENTTESGAGENPTPNPKNPRPRRRTKPPYPWSTKHRAKIHNLTHLHIITGDVKCTNCGQEYRIGFDLVTKFNRISTFIAKNKPDWQNRAPSSWISPVFPNCNLCEQRNCVKPVIDWKDHKKINWLFLLLGQLIGRLNLGQIKYFCAHNKISRTGPKNCLLYSTYLALCNQLQPSNPLFDP